ncbi:hypothetical protein OC842_003179 [Tilletia horrida]|uniref:Eukaryotic translation initiation factor 3 subunit M n=1 Tax=Tilletia horrida TaxID=155126 RepID=A0AAN6GEN3_9BASI|nr:hypothetical protein OC842_003179 [Tilletia horrida]
MAAAPEVTTQLAAAGTGSIVSDSVTVLVDGSFADHLLELAPFLARAVQPTDSRQAFVDSLRKQVGAGAGAGQEEAEDRGAVREALDADAQKRIAVLSFVVNALKTLPEPATDRELEGAFNLLLALILTSPAPAPSTPSASSSSRAGGELSTEQTELVGRLAELVAAPASASSAAPAAADKSIAKYRILTNIFNALPARSPARLTLFLSLLTLAAHSDDLDILSSSVAYAAASSSSAAPPPTTSSFDEASSSASVLLHSLPVWLAQWQLDDARKADVLKQVAQILLKQQQSSSTSGAEAETEAEENDAPGAARTLAFHKLYLRFLDAAETAPAESEAAASTTLALALRLPHVYDFASLLESRAIRSLEQSNPALWTLLVDVVLAPGGRGKQWEAWKAKNADDVLAKAGIPEATLVRKIRLLDIASLCAAQIYSDAALAAAAASAASARPASATDGGGDDAAAAAHSSAAAAASHAEVPYALIASSALPSEPADDVETWVIDVIRAGLVSGKLSQVNEVFRVYRVSSVVPIASPGSAEKEKEAFSRKQWEVLEGKLVAWRESVGRMLTTLNSASKQQQSAIVAAVAQAQAQGAGAEQHAGAQQQQAQAVN